MRSVKVLEMLNEGKINELKNKLQDEIYTYSLKGKPITIQTSIGICMIMPVFIHNENDVELERVIEVKLD